MQPVTASPRCTPRTCTNLRLRLRGSSGCGILSLCPARLTMYTEQEFPTYSTNTRIALALFLLCVSLAGRRSGTRGGFALYEVMR